MRFTAGLALAAGLAISPAALAEAQQTQDTSRTETGRMDTTRDTTRFDTTDVDTTRMQPPDTARRVTDTDTARTGAEPSGVETGVIPAGAGADTTPGAIRNPETASVRFVDTQGNEIGTARVMQTSRGVLVEADVRGLSPGEHAFHFHQTGRCEAPSFESAGDHYAPQKNPHGFLMQQGPHAGDMPNARVLGSGLLQVEVYNPSVTLSGGDAPLLDQDGSALVIHAKADDYKSQPSGDAGERIACAVVSRSAGQQQ
jgi:superoxide dismutase, Cu-Zn family